MKLRLQLQIEYPQSSTIIFDQPKVSSIGCITLIFYDMKPIKGNTG